MKKEDKKYRDPLEISLEYEPEKLQGESEAKEPHYLELFVLFLLSISSAYILIVIDIETNSFTQLMTWQMFLTVLIFAIPGFVTSAFLFEKLVQFYSTKMSIVLSLIIAIPMIFLLIMWFLTN